MLREVPLGPSDRLFESLARKMIDARTPAIDWSALDASGLSDARREQTRCAWSMRVMAEYQSMVVFAEMLARMPEAGLPLSITVAATRLIHDEARHAELCARMADALGGHHDARVHPRSLRLNDGRIEPRLFLARWTLSMLCVGECASVALLDVLRACATDDTARAVLSVIHRDESLHDAFGWALAQRVIPMLNEEEREWVSGDLAQALAHYERTDAGCARPEDVEALGDDDPAHNLGTASQKRFATAFYATLEDRILPGIEALGIPARLAWAHRHDAG